MATNITIIVEPDQVPAPSSIPQLAGGDGDGATLFLTISALVALALICALVVMRVGRFRSLCPFFQSEVIPQNTVRNAAHGRLPALLLDCLEPLCSDDDISDAVSVDYELPYWDTPEQAEASRTSTVWGSVQQFALVFVQRTMSVAAWMPILRDRVVGVDVDGALLPAPIVTTLSHSL